MTASDPPDDGWFIVKVQTALDDPSHPALIYDRERNFFLEVPPEQVEGLMEGRVKRYFHARIRNRLLDLGTVAPDQDW